MSNRVDIIRVVLAILSVIKLSFSAFGVGLPENFVILNTIVNILAGLMTIYAFFKHNFIGKKGKKQKEHLYKNGLL